jgi:hypothetical protein
VAAAEQNIWEADSEKIEMRHPTRKIGFNDSNYVTRQFRKVTGFSPRG